MKIQILKHLNNALPDWMKQIASPWIRRRLINHPIFIAQYRKLKERDLLTPDLQQEQLIQDLRDALKYAYQNSAYYKALFDSAGFAPSTLNALDDLSCLPTMDKASLRAHGREIFVENCTDYYETTTGGSTGAPIGILLDKASIYRERAFIYHYWARFGYDYQKSRLATFRGVVFNGKTSKVNPLYNEILLNPFSLNDLTIDRYVSKMNRFGVDFLQGYPSSVYTLCCCMERKGLSLKKPLKAVFFISENVYPFQEEKVEAVLGCKSHAFYGNSERSVFATQEDDGFYQFDPAYGYAEVTSSGHLLCTGFINRKMPLVRYDTEDAAIAMPNGHYNILGHHDTEMLYGRDDEEISASAINFHSPAMLGVSVYQFVQDIKGKATLHVVAADNAPLDTESIRVAVQQKLGDILVVSVVQTDKLCLTDRGKYKMIIQNYHKK